MSQTIRIKTVKAPPFTEAWNLLTPRLHLVVSYTKGGTSYLTGRDIPRGYEIAIQHDRISEGGTVSMLLDTRAGNPTAILEPAARFSVKTLERITEEVCKGKHDATIAELYTRAKANRSEFAWPESILPIFPDRNDTLEPSLLSKVVASALVAAS
jgi:hypothetical protein